MTSRDFVYFLQGFFEISESTTISEKQAQVIKNHLAMVFIHEIDPSMGDDKQQAKLDEVHSAGTSATRPLWPHRGRSPVMKC